MLIILIQVKVLGEESDAARHFEKVLSAAGGFVGVLLRPFGSFSFMQGP
jgi:hypothetical protein